MRLYVADASLGAGGLVFAMTMNLIQLAIQIGAAVPFLRGLQLNWRDVVRLQQAAAAESAHDGAPARSSATAD